MVVIDTSSGKWSRSYEYVKPEEIVFMRRVTLDEEQKQEEKGYSPYRKTCGLDYMLRGIDRNGKRFIYAYQ